MSKARDPPTKFEFMFTFTLALVFLLSVSNYPDWLTTQSTTYGSEELQVDGGGVGCKLSA